MNEFNTLDYNLLIQIHNLTSNNFFDHIMPGISAMGNFGAIWILISLILIIRKEYRMVGIMCILAVIITTIAGEGIIKHLVQRPRPFVQFPSIQLLISEPATYSFPSGHTASSFAVAFVIADRIRKAALPVFVMASAIAFSRIYLMVHYPTDIIAAVLLGFICAKLTVLLCDKFIIKRGLET
ncbi:MAG: phosphatase PAP2 family protein [Clostridiaceae bacterium]